MKLFLEKLVFVMLNQTDGFSVIRVQKYIFCSPKPAKKQQKDTCVFGKRTEGQKRANIKTT